MDDRENRPSRGDDDLARSTLNAWLPQILLDAADTWPDQLHHALDGESRTFVQLRDEAFRCAGAAQAAGVGAGDRVLVLVERSSDFYPALWGILLAGGVPVPLAGPRSASPEEFGRVLRVHEQLGGPGLVDRGARGPGFDTWAVGEWCAAAPLHSPVC